MGNRTAKLTQTAVNKAEPDPGGRYWINDTEISGFRLVVSPSGKKVFYLRYRLGGGRSGTPKEYRIGDHPTLKAEKARHIAQETRAAILQGDNPSAHRQAQREAPRIDELFDRYMSEHARPNKKPSSIEEDERLIRHFLRPTFGKMKVSEVKRKDVMKFHHALREKPYRANRSVALLSKAMNLAEAWGLRPLNSNPCTHLTKYKERKVERFLSPAELAALGEALKRAEAGELGPMSPYAVAAIRLLVFTGARKSEILGLRWGWIDMEGGRIRLPDGKTGAKTIPLNGAALELLQALPRVEGNPHVIVGGKPGAALVNLKDPWAVIRNAAG